MKSDKTNGADDVAADQANSRKRPKLMLERQVIRTLTGDELKMIGGGLNCHPTAGPPCTGSHPK